MDLLDLIKATVICGLLAFLCYTFPVLGQAVMIGLLALLWLCYARSALIRMLRR